jgi:hypothetical protein
MQLGEDSAIVPNCACIVQSRDVMASLFGLGEESLLFTGGPESPPLAYSFS